MIIRYILAVLCLVFGANSARGQNIDSLKALLAHAKGGERVDVLYELSYDHIGINNNTALRYGVEGYALALELNDSLRILKTGLVTASALRRIDMIDSALAVSKRILPISERNGYLNLRAILLNSMGILYNYKARYDKALQCYVESLGIRQATADTASQLVVMRNIGVVYYKLKNYEKALEIFTDNARMHNRIGSFQDADLLLLNIASCFAYLARFDSAQFYVRKALTQCVAGCSEDRYCQANFVNGLIHFGQKDWKRAESYFLESLRLATSLNDVRLQLDNIDYLSRLYLHLGRFNSVSRYLTIGRRVISQNHSYNLERIKIYSRFAELYSITGDFKKASHFQWLHSQLRDSVYNDNMTRNLMNAEAEFLERENSARITAQNEMLVLKEEIIRHERVKNNILIVLGLLCAVLLILLYRDYRRKKSVNFRLEKKVIERTQELQRSRDEMLVTLKEHDMILHRTSKHLRETVTTIKGLCRAGINDISDPTAIRYIRKIESSSGQLEKRIQEVADI